MPAPGTSRAEDMGITMPVAAADEAVEAAPAQQTLATQGDIRDTPGTNANAYNASDHSRDGGDAHDSDGEFGAMTDADRTLTKLCTDASFDLEDWEQQLRDSSHAQPTKLLLAADFARTVHDDAGRLWKAHDMRKCLQQQKGRLVAARFYRNASLVRLAAWADALKTKPDMLSRYSSLDDRETAVLNVPVEGDEQRRSRSMCRKELQAGWHWRRLVAQFGVGVLILQPKAMGFTKQGYVYFLELADVLRPRFYPFVTVHSLFIVSPPSHGDAT